jgi:hypothetical protein
MKEGWNRWYRAVRDEMAFRYGVRRVPVDLYKEQWALGCSPEQGARAIYMHDMARWERRGTK